MKFGAKHVYLEGEPGAGGGGAGVAPAAPTPPAGGAAATAGQPGAAPSPGAPASGDGNPTGSALSAGQEWTIESIPEKYRVKGADDQFDLQATIRKVDEARSALEKRMGTGDIRPKSPTDYKLPESDVFKNLQIDETQAKAFQEKAHGWGLSQGQYEAVMSEWATLAPGLVNAGQAETVEGAVTALKEVWKDQYDANIKESFRVVSQVAESAGIPFDEVEKAIGNNPVAIRLFAALAPEMREDATPAAANGGTGGGAQTREQYVQENWAAYTNPADPKHKTVTERAQALAAREAKRMPTT